ncbi:transglutaminase domain-containing protein, partial [Candidatus Micrarchaeota archaeon]|nr:transglutaminase domain-containing protein [Candidatus Micrarchaeota archaeon]
AITNWVYNHITYNLSYTDKRLPASEVYKIRQGTCDEYSHLTISMLKTLGIPARFVKGYSFSNKTWEPHAWVEYYNPKYGWLPIDPTFDEYVYLSGEKIAIVSADEQNDEMADSVSAIGHGKFNVALSSEINIKTIKTENRKIRFSIQHNTDTETNNSNIEIKIILENLEDKYYFVPTTLVLPFDVGGYNKNIIVLAPYEKKVIIKRVNVSALENGNYKIPYHLNMFGYEYSGSFDLINHKSGSQNGNEKESGINGNQLVNDMTRYWWLLLAPVVYFILTVIFRRLNRKQKI